MKQKKKLENSRPMRKTGTRDHLQTTFYCCMGNVSWSGSQYNHNSILSVPLSHPAFRTQRRVTTISALAAWQGEGQDSTQQDNTAAAPAQSQGEEDTGRRLKEISTGGWLCPWVFGVTHILGQVNILSLCYVYSFKSSNITPHRQHVHTPYPIE